MRRQGPCNPILPGMDSTDFELLVARRITRNDDDTLDLIGCYLRRLAPGPLEFDVMFSVPASADSGRENNVGLHLVETARDKRLAGVELGYVDAFRTGTHVHTILRVGCRRIPQGDYELRVTFNDVRFPAWGLRVGTADR